LLGAAVAAQTPTPSQNVLESLANWHQGQVEEELVRMVRLTRPEVIISWMPGIFVGENHGAL
jgi:hypothetical protein